MVAQGIYLLKIVQLNLWNGRLIKASLDLLRREQPDFLTLQEVYSSVIRTSSHDFFASYERIQEYFPDYHCYFSPRSALPVFDKTVNYGNAIFSKYPYLHKETIEVSGTFHSDRTVAEYLVTEGQKDCFNLQRVQIDLNGGKSFCLINYHGYWEPNHLGTEATIPVMEKVAGIIKESPRPLVLAGDLNVVAESPSMKPIHALLRDLTAEFNYQSTMTQFAKLPDVAPDHICVSDRVDVKKFEVLDDIVSDHKALVLEFDIN